MLNQTEDDVYACIITHNRRDILLECLRAIYSQTYPVSGVVVLDNASTDETDKMLRAEGFLEQAQFIYHRNDTNTGVSPGFEQLVGLGYEQGSSWIWVMDDDIIPDRDALSELISASHHFDSPSDLGFLISAATTPDGQENNVPHPDTRRDRSCWTVRPEPMWAHLLAYGMVRVRHAAMTSILIPRTTVEACGLPSGDFAVLGEDADYTLRMSEWRPSYLVGRSRVVHKRATPGYIHILTEVDEARLERLYYYYRNFFYIRKRYHPINEFITFLLQALYHLVHILHAPGFRLRRARYLVLGMAAGLIFRPRHKPLASARGEGESARQTSGKLKAPTASDLPGNNVQSASRSLNHT
jgi:dTDP-4-dehydrorhamnose reductase